MVAYSLVYTISLIQFYSSPLWNTDFFKDILLSKLAIIFLIYKWDKTKQGIKSTLVIYDILSKFFNQQIIDILHNLGENSGLLDKI